LNPVVLGSRVDRRFRAVLDLREVLSVLAVRGHLVGRQIRVVLAVLGLRPLLVGLVGLVGLAGFGLALLVVRGLQAVLVIRVVQRVLEGQVGLAVAVRRTFRAGLGLRVVQMVLGVRGFLADLLGKVCMVA